MAYKLIFLPCNKLIYHWVYKQYPLGHTYIDGDITFSPAVQGNRNTYLLGFGIPYMCPQPSRKWLFNRIKEMMSEQDFINV